MRSEYIKRTAKVFYHQEQMPLRGSLLFLAALSFLAYSPSLSGDFLQDDHANILDNRSLEDPRQWPRFFYDPGSVTIAPDSTDSYRPLMALSFALNLKLGGRNPFWFHLADILLHALNTLLVFILARRVLGAGVPALAAALLFCLHPAQAESVAYISGARPNGLALLLALASFLWALPPRPRPAASAAAFAVALLCKESALFLPLALASHDLALRPPEPWRARLGRWAPYLGLTLLYLTLRQAVLGKLAQVPVAPDGLGQQVELMLHGLWQDLRIALWPWGLRPCYSHAPASASWAENVLLALLFLILCAAAILALRRGSLAGFALAWFLVALLPVSHLVPIVILAADRFLHAPLVGLGLLWGCLLARLAPLQGGLAGACLALLLGLACLERQLAWQNEFELDSSALSSAPEEPCAALLLSTHYFNWDMLGRAEALAAKARSGRAPRRLRENSERVSAFISRRAQARRRSRARE